MKATTRRTLSVSGILFAVALATVYGFLPKTIDVDLVDVSRGPLQITIEEEGRTRLKERFVISAPTAGYLRRIDLKVGDPVRRGQTVAVLEPLRSPALDPRTRAEAEATVASAQAGLDGALQKERATTADLDYIDKRLERVKNLYAKGVVARDLFDQTEAEAKKARALQRTAQAAVDGSRAELERVQRTLQHFPPDATREHPGSVPITSPVGGSLFRLTRESEGAVNVGEPLMEIGNVRNLEVRVELLSSDAVRIMRGMPVMFKRWGGEGTLTGVVRVVEPAGFTKISSLGVEEQRVLVIADITSPPEQWRVLGDGYRLEAHFIVWEGKEVLQVPASALFRTGKAWSAYVEENRTAKHRIVEVGQRNGLAAEILSGLKEKDKVIAHPDDAIGDGTPIRPIQ